MVACRTGGPMPTPIVYIISARFMALRAINYKYGGRRGRKRALRAKSDTGRVKPFYINVHLQLHQCLFEENCLERRESLNLF